METYHGFTDSWRTITVGGESILLAAFLWGETCGFAREITCEEALRAVGNWAKATEAPLGAQGIAGERVLEVETKTDEDGRELYHVVRMESGAIVITSAESGILPIIAFSDSGGASGSENHPIWDILQADMRGRLEAVAETRKQESSRHLRRESSGDFLQSSESIASGIDENEAAWERLLHPRQTKTKAVSSISDVRVPALIKTSWGQDVVGSKKVYNYYTPNSYCCGCVATAMAQLMRYHMYPQSSVSRVSRQCWVDDSPTTQSTYGGTYSWSSMPTNPAKVSLTTTQQQAMGKLCYDAGVSVRMNWRSTGSGAWIPLVADALKDVWTYSSAVCVHNQGKTVPASAVTNAVFANLDAKMPVLFDVKGVKNNTGKDVAHAIIGDGYGFNGATPYTHINLGWDGSTNDLYWYNLPTIKAGEYSFTILRGIVYNVFPSKTGSLITGRVLDSSNKPRQGVSVRGTKGSTVITGTTDSHGIYALWAPSAGTYSVVASSGSLSSPAKSVMVSACTSAEFKVDSTGAGYFSGCSGGTVGNSWGNDLVLNAETGKPNLASYIPKTKYGWTVPVFVTGMKGGANALASFPASSTAYLNFAYQNSGTAIAGSHQVSASILNSSGTTVSNWSWSKGALATNTFRRITNIVFSVKTPGTYTARIRLDSGGEVAESNESDNTYSTTFVVEPPKVSNLTISGSSSVASGGSATYTCTANYSDGSSESVTPSWSLGLVSGYSFGSISPDGVFTADETTVTINVTIQASYGGMSVQKTVTVNAAPATLHRVSISGSSAVAQGGSATYTCTAEYTDGTSRKVTPTWSLTSGASWASITARGVFTAKATSEDRTVAIAAVFEGKTGEKMVAVKPSVAADTGAELYMVVDMSGGPNAASWPVTYLDREPADGWSDEYKTTKLVLRRIAPGTFTMGSPVGELGRGVSEDWGDETQHKVTLTKPFYMGVFELTVKQWESAMGWNSNLTGQFGMDPLVGSSYLDFRGSNLNAVAEGSLVAVLRKKTGQAFDLPTEAQWEYACRAGTTTALNSGKSLTGTELCTNLAELGRHGYSNNGMLMWTTVGSFLPNKWGLYDMHGNLREWTRDCLKLSSAPAEMTDPLGTFSGAVRGGGWFDRAANCRSASRIDGVPVGRGLATIGCRLSCPDSGSASLTLAASERSFTATAANSKELGVMATVSWTAKSSASWLAVKTASGKGNGKIVYNVAANTGMAARTGKITVTGGGVTRTFTVTQGGKTGGGTSTATLMLGASERSFTTDAASGKELVVTANVSWTVKSSVSWLMVKTASGKGNGKIVYNVAANTGTGSRTGKITVTGGGLTRTFTVTQSGKDTRLLLLGAHSRTFSAAAANNKELAVTAGQSWSAESLVPWLVLKTKSGKGNGKIVYNVAANPSTSSRVCGITVRGGGLTRYFMVTQNGRATAALTLNASSRSFTASAASSKELGVTASVPWTAKSSASWLAVKTVSGKGNGKIVYNVAANTGAGARTGRITVTGGGLTRTFTVTQSGKTVTLTLGAGSRTFTASAANSKELAVTANVAWKVLSSASWLKIKTASGKGNGKIVYNVAAYKGTGSRTGLIMVSGGGKTVSCSIVQLGGTPNLHFYQPSGWPAAMFVTTHESNTTTRTSFTASTTPLVCIRWAWDNNGNTVAPMHKVRFDVTGPSTWSTTMTMNALDTTHYRSRHMYYGLINSSNIIYAAPSKAGVYTATVTLDPDNEMPETNESDNKRSVTFTVVDQSPLDLGVAKSSHSKNASTSNQGDWVVVTTSDQTDGGVLLDGDEGTIWGPVGEGGGWVVLSYSEAIDVKGVSVKGENLPEEGVRILLSEDADDWREECDGRAQYVWVVVPEGAEGARLTEILVEEE